MPEKKCRYCKGRNATSKEHIIVDSRLRNINKFKNLAQRDDDIRKIYRHITCDACNHVLGEYESKDWIHLAYATIWKILAGNTNNAFKEESEYVLRHSDELCTKDLEYRFLDVIKSNKVLPNHTFTFSMDDRTLNFENKPGKAITNTSIRCVDDLGRPVEGAKVCMFQNNARIGDESTTDEKGQASLKVLMGLEMVKIVSEKLTIQNKDTKEEIYMDFDIIIYISIGPGNHRILVLAPLICSHMYNIGWSNPKLYHKDTLKIVQKHISDARIVELKRVFDGQGNVRQSG